MNENVNESMGAIIARKRKELGLTQEQLAGELGISYQAVSKWENELSSPDISTLPLLADLFDITIDELFGRVPTKAEPEQALIPAAEPVRRVRVPGGDFFSSDQYASVRQEDDNFFSRMRIGSAGGRREREWEDPEMGFCTETLAAIYADQGYFAEAKKIYSRLILRFPEKSAYFASLIEKLDKEN